MLDFIKSTFQQFLLDYRSGGFMSVLSYVVLAIFIIFSIGIGIVLLKTFIQQMLLIKSNQKITKATVVEKKVVRRPFFMKWFGDTKDKYIVVLRIKKMGHDKQVPAEYEDLEYEDVEFYAHSQVNKRYEATYYEIYLFGKFYELRVTDVKFVVN
jgi:hypothetical protein